MGIKLKLGKKSAPKSSGLRTASKGKKPYTEAEYKAMVTGIRSMLKVLKEFGLISQSTHFKSIAEKELRESIKEAALRWYKVGGRRGIRLTLQHVLDGKICVGSKAGKPYFSKLDKIDWCVKRLRVSIGDSEEIVSFDGFRPDPKKLLKKK